MSAPMYATTTDDARFYEWPLLPGNHLPSITTCIKHGVPKPTLTKWAVKKAARLAMDEVDTLVALRELAASAPPKKVRANANS